MEKIALLCLLGTLITSQLWLVARVVRLSKAVSRSMKRAQAPEKWELRLRELADEVLSLSSSCEKVSAQLRRQNSRQGMRDLRDQRAEKRGPPPPGASKSELREYYSDVLAQRGAPQLELVQKD